MKHLLLAASALTLIAGPAFGQAAGQASSTVEFTGKVTSVCGIGAPKHTYPNGTTTAAHTAPLPLGELIDGNGWVVANTHTVSFGNMWCNGAGASITLSASPLRRDSVLVDAGEDSNSFTNRINFSVSRDFPAPLGTQTVSTASLPVNSAGGNLGAPLTFPIAFETGIGQYSQAEISIISTDLRPIAGDYSGWVRVTLQAAQ